MCQPQLESGKHARLPNSKTKGKVYPWNHSTSCIPKKESKSCSLAKKHSNAFNPERLSQMLRSFKPPSVHWRESIPSKHWCHATHRLPGASPSKINCCKVAASSNTNSPGLFPLPPPKKNSHLCGSFARTDAANEFTQFDGHGGATGPAGDPAVPPRPGFSDSTRLSRGVVGGEVNHGFIQVTLFVGGTQPPSPFKKQRNHSSSLFVGGTLLHECWIRKGMALGMFTNLPNPQKTKHNRHHYYILTRGSLKQPHLALLLSGGMPKQ